MTPEQAGTYTVEITLAECATRICYVGLGIYRRGGGQPSLAQGGAPGQQRSDLAVPGSDAGSADPQTNGLNEADVVAFDLKVKSETFWNAEMDVQFKPLQFVVFTGEDDAYRELGIDACLPYSGMRGTRVIRGYHKPLTDDLFLASRDEGQRFAAEHEFDEMGTEGTVLDRQEARAIPLMLYWNGNRGEFGDAVSVASPEYRQLVESMGYTPISEEGFVYPAEYCQP